MTERTCIHCRKTKPLEVFHSNPTATGGVGNVCKDCHRPLHAANRRKVRAGVPAEEKAREMAAYRAGMRKDKCAVCGSAIEGHGICDACMDAVAVLGGSPDALKRAAKALKYVQDVMPVT